MKYEPWRDSRALQKFERADKSGRWNPLITKERDWAERHPVVIAWIVVIATLAAVWLVRDV